jgi:hypothetical protein
MSQRLSGLWVIVALTLFYALGHLVWYLGTPLGQVPVLDERENILLAGQIAHGQLPAEPFYRAMGYPLVLAGFLRVGIAPAQLTAVALGLGALLHAINALLTGRLAGRLFSNRRAAWLAALFAGFNPVLLHYAVSVLDATLGTTFFLLGCLALFRAPRDSENSGSSQTPTLKSTGAEAARPTLVAGAWWALATLTRPQFLPLWLALPFLVWLRQRNRTGWLFGCGALALGGGLFLAQGLWQRQVSGEFRLLPWQGPYNLWAANKPGAHGRYFVQTLFVASNAAQENPTKLETLALYGQETGLPPADIDTVNAHWKTRFVQYVTGHPFTWAGQLARKTYALFNNWEQYNNKTYAFHKARSPWLRWNPLGWGVLLLSALPGAWLLLRRRPADAAALLALGGLYAAGVILYFVSARFRLPLASLLAVLAGGAWAHPSALATLPRPRLLALLALGGALTFSRFFGVHDEKPFLQDRILLARAAQRVGDDATALAEAREAAATTAYHPEIAELLVTSWFNLALQTPAPPDATVLTAARGIGADSARLASGTVAVAGVALVAAGKTDEAIALWRERPTPDTWAALVLSGKATAEEASRFAALAPNPNDNVLIRFARLRPDDRPATLTSFFNSRRP